MGWNGDGRNVRNFFVKNLVIQNQEILNIKTVDNLLSASVYVGFRRQRPNETTVKGVLKELQ